MRSPRGALHLVPDAANPVTRQKVDAGSLEPRALLFIDAGAVAALRRGKSLLPAGCNPGRRPIRPPAMP